MQLNGIESVVDDAFDTLPNGLQKPNPTVIPTPFLNQDNDGPQKLAWNSAVDPCCLD